MVKYHIIAFSIGIILDLVIGDPQQFPHPVRFIGKLIAKLDHIFMDAKIQSGVRDEQAERKCGVWTVWIVCVTTVLVVAALLFAGYGIHFALGIFVEALLSWTIFAAKSLRVESMKVYQALKEENVENARFAVSMIVGRDTECLNEEGIVKATVETIAENTSDGVIAPLLFTCVGGPVLGMLYKSINTMDSMIGYRNERYMNFGRCAARLDDVVNFIPSRISAFMMIIVAYMGKEYSGKEALRIFKRDRFCHKSPNSAQTESACAGALLIKLAGDASYFGKVVKKPYIGDASKPIEYEDIKRANKLMYGTAFLTMVVCYIYLFCLITM